MEINSDDAHYKGCLTLLSLYMFALVALGFFQLVKDNVFTTLFVLWFVCFLVLWIAEKIYKWRHLEP